MIETVERTFSFADFELDTAKRLLLKDGQPLSLNPKAFDLLTLLVKNRGRTLSKEELLETVWENQFVEENNLTVHISALRKIFGEKKGEHQFIVTIPGTGYKFVAEIQQEVNNSLVKTDDAADKNQNSKSFDEPDGIIGRAREISEIKGLLGRHNKCLVTLTGAGGSGKTKLAQAIIGEMQPEFADGAFFIELASVNQPALVVGAIAQTLGIKESSDKSLFDMLKDFLRARSLLLVLDNFEQLLAAAAVLKELFDSAANLKILVTSRTPLRLKFEQEIVISPLAVPPRDANLSAEELTVYPAAELFAVRAQAARPNFGLNAENAPVIAEICERLDGLPLAIELAAVRVKLLSPQAILARLENSLNLLTGGARDLPSRQRTMRGAIEWSYELLDREEKFLFRRLAVFSGGFTVEAAEAIGEKELKIGENSLDLPVSVLDLLTSLIDNNLLIQKELPDGNMRLRMLEVVREFALECLEANGELEILAQNHARFFLALAQEAETNFSGEQGSEWLEKLETEVDNLRAALRWSLDNEAETGVRLAVAIREFWASHCYFTEGCSWLKAALERDNGNVSAEVRFKLLFGLGFLTRQLGDYETSRQAHEQGLAEAEALGDKRQIAWSTRGLGAVAYRQSDFAAARKFIETSLTISRELEDKPGIANSLNSLGDLLQVEGETARARETLEEGLAILRQLGIKQFLTSSLYNLGSVAYRQRDFAASQQYFAEGLATAREFGQKSIISYCLDGFGALAVERGESEQSAQLSGAAEKLRELIGYESGPAERRFRTEYLAKVRAALDEKTFADAYEQGKTMNLDESIALVKVFDPQVVFGFETETSEIIIENHSFSRIIIEEEIES
jgi:predicted ATPase/DNA-binding winged helix-turn-helix (wHTH) protein